VTAEPDVAVVEVDGAAESVLYLATDGITGGCDVTCMMCMELCSTGAVVQAGHRQEDWCHQQCSIPGVADATAIVRPFRLVVTQLLARLPNVTRHVILTCSCWWLCCACYLVCRGGL
jgi:hypothetical protein